MLGSVSPDVMRGGVFDYDDDEEVTQFTIPAGQRLFRTSPTACDYTDSKLLMQRRYSSEIDKTGIYFATWPFLSMAMALEYGNDVQLAVFRTSAPITVTIGKYNAPGKSHFDHNVNPIAYSQKPHPGGHPVAGSFDLLTLQQEDLFQSALWTGELFIVEQEQILNIHFMEAFTLSHDKLLQDLLDTFEAGELFDMFTLAPYIAKGVLVSMTCPDAAEATTLNEDNFRPHAVDNAYKAANRALYKYEEGKQEYRDFQKYKDDTYGKFLASKAFKMAKDAKTFLDAHPDFAASLFKARAETALFLSSDPRRDTVTVNDNVTHSEDNPCLLKSTPNIPLTWSGDATKEFPLNSQPGHTHVLKCTEENAEALRSVVGRQLTDAERAALPFHLPSHTDYRTMLRGSVFYQSDAQRYNPCAEHVVSERAIVTILPSPGLMEYIFRRANKYPEPSPGEDDVRTDYVIDEIVATRPDELLVEKIAEAVREGRMDTTDFNAFYIDLVSTNKHDIANQVVVKKHEPLFYIQILPMQRMQLSLSGGHAPLRGGEAYNVMNTLIYSTPLTPVQAARVEDALSRDKAQEAPLVTIGPQVLTRRIATQFLGPRAWLNDEVINMYLELVNQRSAREEQASKPSPRVHAFSTMFYKQLAELPEGAPAYNFQAASGYTRPRKSGQTINIFRKTLLLIPINPQGNHWALIAVFVQWRRVQVLDSLNYDVRAALANVMRYLGDEWRVLHPTKPFKESEWQVGPPDHPMLTGVHKCAIPKQLNGYDCGIFTCMYADFLAEGLLPVFTQAQVPFLRQRVLTCLLERKVPSVYIA